MSRNAQKAKNWFISSYPLLGALASTFKIIEDPIICSRMEISVAAINEELSEIYINPAAALDYNESKFTQFKLLWVVTAHLFCHYL